MSDIINIDDLYGNQREIAEVIGIDNYIKLSKYENCVRKDTVHQNLRKCITYQQDISVCFVNLRRIFRWIF